MTQLTVIADDFTGALDTGVQFANKKITVKVVTAEQYAARQGDLACDVMVIDAETRHLSAQEAYEKTLALVRKVKANDTQTLYMKTDSGLRGNIGAMLCAAVHGFSAGFAAFAPAFPDMNRVTVDGVQYIDGVPIDESVFGQDPFEPVKAHFIRELLDGWNLTVQEYRRGADYEALGQERQRPVIGIYDIEKNEDFHHLLAHLRQTGQDKVLCGCAGFAAALVPHLGLAGERHIAPKLKKSLLVVCGSLNPITQQQIEFAQRAGFVRFCLTEHQKHSEQYLATQEAHAWLRQVRAQMQAGQSIVIDTFAHAQLQTNSSSEQADADRARIATRLGALLKLLLLCGETERYLVMIIGGDTLMGLIAQLPSAQIMPVCEIAPGAVLFSVTGAPAKAQFLISKSGGFGAENLLVQIETAFLGGNRDEPFLA